MVPTSTLAVHPGNTAQARSWDGDEGCYRAAHADVVERSVARYDQALFAAAGIGPTDRVLDLGCGTGATTCAAGRRARAGNVTGVDLSSAMLEVGRRTAAAEGLEHVSFVQADAQVHPFAEGCFDVAISRTGARARATARRPVTLRPVRASPRARLLRAAGFPGVGLTGIGEPMWFGPDATAAFDFVVGLLGWLLAGHDAGAREQALATLRWVLAQHDGPDGVEFDSACWLVTARCAG